MKERLMNNIGLKILAFLSAMLMWLLVVNGDDPVSEKTYVSVPVTVINPEVITADGTGRTYQIVDKTQSVSVVVNAKRSLLSKIRTDDIVATADMKELTLGTQIPIKITINGYEGRYENAQADPRNLQVKIEGETSKKFPITPVTKGTVRDGYVMGEIKAVPEKVSLKGPESIISQISRVVAEVDVSGLSSDRTLPSKLMLYNADNVLIDQTLLSNNLGEDGVGVSIQLLHTKSIPLVFDTSLIQPKEGYSFSGITFEPGEIQVSGSEEDLSQLTQIGIPADAIAVADITEKTEKVVDITPYVPSAVKLADENANSVIVTISVERNGTKTFNVPLASIAVDNLSESLKMTYVDTDNVEVQIKGPADELNDLVLDRKLSIDLKDYAEEGTFEVPVKAELPNGCTLDKEIKVNLILEKK